MATPEALPKFSLALGSKKTIAPTRTKRPHSSLQDSDDEDTSAPRTQEVSHFDQAAGGAIDSSRPKEEKAPLVIAKLQNRNWKDESRRKRQRNGLPAEAQAAQVDGSQNGNREIFTGGPTEYGLIIAQKTEETSTSLANGGAVEVQGAVADQPVVSKTDDELALQALLGDKPQSSFVLPAVVSEEETLQRQYREAPEVATLEDYAAVPVEDFGAALLRGMGWKDGQGIGRGQQAAKPQILQRRPDLLGIGAKAEAAAGIELGAWGKGAKGKKKAEQTYNPVVLRHKITGERLTEEELKAKIENEKFLEEEERRYKHSRRSPSPKRSSKSRKYDDKYDDVDYDRKSKGKSKRDYSNDRSSHKDDHSRRNRSVSADSRHRRHRRYEEVDDDRRNKSRRHRDRSSSVNSRRRSRKYNDFEDDGRDSDRRRKHGYEDRDRDSSRKEHRGRDKYEDSGRRHRRDEY